MNLRRAIAGVVLAVVFGAAGHARPETVPLPAPATDGQVSLEMTLKERRSIRSIAARPISLRELSQLCWSAQGVTDKSGHRTAPSAGAVYPLSVYVIAGNVTGLTAGVWLYRPQTHALELVASGDQRAAFVGKVSSQDWIAEAPAIVVLAGDVKKMSSRYGDRAAPFVWIEAGLAAQGFLLETTALGLASTYVGGFRPDAARAFLSLGESHEVMAVLPVGHPR